MNRNMLKKQALLVSAGVTLQFLGGVCLCTASLLAAKEMGNQIRKHLELLRDMETTSA